MRWFYLTIFFISFITQGLAAQNREAYFIEAAFHLAFYLNNISEHLFVNLDPSEKEIYEELKQIALKQNLYLHKDFGDGSKYEFDIKFSDKSEFFKLRPNEPERTAMTYSEDYESVWVNKNRVNLPDLEMKYLDAVQLMLHEFGHKIRNKNQAAVDSLAAKIRQELEQYYFEYELREGLSVEGLLIPKNTYYEKNDLAKWRWALTNKELVLFTKTEHNIKSIGQTLYDHLKNYRGYEANTNMNWWSPEYKSPTSPDTVIPLALKLSPLSNQNKLVLQFNFQVFDNTLFPYREPRKPNNRNGTWVGTEPKASDYLKQKNLSTQIYYTSSGELEFVTLNLKPENFSQSIKVLSAGFSKKNQYVVVVESEESNLFLVLETDLSSQIFIKGESIKESPGQIRFVYKVPQQIAAQSLLFDHFLDAQSQVIYASEGYRLKIPHLKNQANSLEILSRDIEIQDINDTQLKVTIKMQVLSKSPIQTLQVTFKTVTEIINGTMAKMGYRKDTSYYRIDKHQIDFTKDQIRQKKIGDIWLVESDFIDHKIPAEYVEDPYLKSEYGNHFFVLPRPGDTLNPLTEDSEGRAYRVFPILSEDTGDRWITELNIINEQLENYREFDSDGIVRYNNKALLVQHNSKSLSLPQNFNSSGNRCDEIF